MIIAYDLDGVFISDCDRLPFIGGLDEFYTVTSKMRPVFTPTDNFAIITARPAEFKAITIQWCKDYLPNMPICVFHDCANETPAEYKASVLNNYQNITKYVESDAEIVLQLRKLVTTGCEIVHFEKFLQDALTKL